LMFVVIFSFSVLILLIWVFSLLILLRFSVYQSYLFKEPTFCFVDSLSFFFVCVCVSVSWF
jgi:hypothetical protein